MGAESVKPEESIEGYCPYEDKPVSDNCADCKGGKVQFEYEFFQPGYGKKSGFHSYRCPNKFSFNGERIKEYNKNREKD